MYKKHLQHLFPLFAGLVTYYIISKYFPEKEETNSTTGKEKLRGGHIEEVYSLVKKFMQRKALKGAIIAVFIAAGQTFYSKEVIKLLSSNKFIEKCYNKGQVVNLPICKKIDELNLHKHTSEIRQLIINDQISSNDKIKLLSIKLEWIIKGEYPGKKGYLILILVSIIISSVVTGVGGLSLFLAALYELFSSGRLDEAVYTQLRKIISKQMNLPLDSFPSID